MKQHIKKNKKLSERQEGLPNYLVEYGESPLVKNHLDDLISRWNNEAASTTDAKRNYFARKMVSKLKLIKTSLLANMPEMAVFIATSNSDFTSIFLGHCGDGQIKIPKHKQEKCSLPGVKFSPVDDNKVSFDGKFLFLPNEGLVGRPQRTGGKKGSEIVKSKHIEGQPDKILLVFEKYLKIYPRDRTLAMTETMSECRVGKSTVTRALRGTIFAAPKDRPKIK